MQSHHPALKKVTLVLNDEIQKVCEAYNKARPEQLEASVVFQSEQQQEELRDQIINQATDDLNTAALGRFGGNLGVVAAVGMGLFKQIINKTFGNDGKIKEIQVNLISGKDQLESNKNIDDNTFDFLNRCHQHILHYLRLKQSRGYFLGFGKNFSEDHLDDPKCLTAYCFLRKVEMAAGANTIDSCKKHIAHLEKFLQLSSENTELVKTKSDDTRFLALRTLIWLLKVEIEKHKDNASKEKIGAQLINELSELNKSIATHSYGVAREDSDRLLKIGTEYNMLNISTYTNGDQVTKKLPDYKKLANDNLFIKLYDAYIDNDVNLEINNIHSLIKNASGISDDKKISQEACQAFQVIFNQIKYIYQLRNLLTEIKKLQEMGGYSALLAVIEEMHTLQTLLRQAIIDLKGAQKEFFKKMQPIYLASQNATFKNNLVNLAWNNKYSNSEDDLVDKLDTGIYLSDKIKQYKNELNYKLNNEISRKIKEIKAGVIKIENKNNNNPENRNRNSNPDAPFRDSPTPSSNPPISNPPITISNSSSPTTRAPTAETTEADKLSDDKNDQKNEIDEILESFVIPDLENSQKNGAPLFVPDIIKKAGEGRMGTIFNLLTKNNRQDIIDDLKKEVNSLGEENKELKKENEELKKEKISLKEDVQKQADASRISKQAEEENVATINSLRDNLNKINEQATAISKKKNTITDITKTFHQFCDDYKNKTTRGFWGFFSIHGNAGRDTAKKFQIKFNQKMTELKERIEKEPQIDVMSLVKDTYHTLISEQQKNLMGGYSHHSFKTYLLAFADYLKDDDKCRIGEGKVIVYHNSMYLRKSTKQNEENYLKTFNNNHINNNNDNDNYENIQIGRKGSK